MSELPGPSQHPLQYALVSGLDYPSLPIVYDTEDLGDDQVLRRLREHPGDLSMSALWKLDHLDGYRLEIKISRYNRCPTCEQWSPCDARRLPDEEARPDTG